jgi:hypothetical protein
MVRNILLAGFLLCYSLTSVSQNAVPLPASAVKQGQPGSIQLKRVVGTGNTTGHIANLSVANTGNTKAVLEIPVLFIPSTGQYQPYIVPLPTPVVIEPKSEVTVPVNGFCADIQRPPVPAGTEIPVQQILNGIAACAPENRITGALPKVSSSPDGTLQPERVIPFTDLNTTGPILLKAIQDITAAYDALKNKGSITTPFSGNPEKERESVIQQTFWIYTSGIQGKQYSKSDFSENTIKQYNTNMTVPYEKTTAAQQQSIQKGVDDFWNTFAAVGAEAKIISL